MLLTFIGILCVLEGGLFAAPGRPHPSVIDGNSIWHLYSIRTQHRKLLKPIEIQHQPLQTRHIHIYFSILCVNRLIFAARRI